jgi:hypothetical protein
MPAAIQVEKQSEGRYHITVQEGRSRSSHLVTVPGGYDKKLTAGRASTEELVRRSFEFLLEREPKESILSSFDLPVIGRYFPEYEGEIKKRLAG